VESAAHILVDSDAVRTEALRVLGLPPDRVTTVHIGISPRYRVQTPEEIAAVRERLQLPARYLLYVGTVEPRKNLTTLLRAYCDLPREVTDACPLVLGGSWGWKSEPVRELFEAEARHRGVRYLGYVADEDLPGLYAGANALLYPSFYEGFGLPPVEAMACGCPAIVSTADAVREVVGSRAIQFDPNDLAAWRDAMLRAIREPDSFSEYRRAGIDHAAHFSWERAARTVRGVYQTVLGVGSTSQPSRSSRAA
jgi:alpha-1,3-rhamnosyl/mannosyltransferase